MTNTIRVGMSELAVAKNPDRIETQALGSCVGTVLYEPYAMVGGVSHAMLPDQNDAKKASRSNFAKFVNTAIDALVDLMLKRGANRKLIKARIAGGANMFPDISVKTENIGKRNTDAAKKKLEALGIPVIAEDIGGSCGRTICLDTATGKLKVRTIFCGEKEI